jgi:hypothetical protein
MLGMIIDSRDGYTYTSLTAGLGWVGRYAAIVTTMPVTTLYALMIFLMPF